MTEIIKKSWDTVLILGIGLILAIVAIMEMGGMKALTNYASAATTSEVTVTATVSPWLDISVDDSSPDLLPALVDTVGDVHIGSSTVAISIGTNSSPGWQINIKGLNDGLDYGATDTIASVTASTTIVAGTDGYGANATNSIADVTIGSLYNDWGTDNAGEIKTGGQSLAWKNSLQSLQPVVSMKIMAAATSTKTSGDYTDTITLTVTSGIP